MSKKPCTELNSQQTCQENRTYKSQVLKDTAEKRLLGRFFCFVGYKENLTITQRECGVEFQVKRIQKDDLPGKSNI